MKQFAVIGIGNFGYYLAKHLYKKGHDVLAVDIDPKVVQKIKDDVSQAITADATDLEAIQELGLSEFDTVILSTGSVLSNSILSALNLVELGLKNIHAKALSEEHGRILKKIGVPEVFFPEKDLAVSMAERLNSPDMLEYLPSIDGYSMISLVVPKKFIGKDLKGLNLINAYGVQVIAVTECGSDKINMIPTADFTVKEGDKLILLGPDKSLDRLRSL